MSTALGSRVCGALGCHREVDISPTGIRHARCRDHESEKQTGAFGSQPGGSREFPWLRVVLPADRHEAVAVGVDTD